jgi:cation transport ATPase-like protein
MASLNSGQQGLSFDEILRRLGEYGPNRVEEVIHESSVFAVSERIQPFFCIDSMDRRSAGLSCGLDRPGSRHGRSATPSWGSS